MLGGAWPAWLMGFSQGRWSGSGKPSRMILRTSARPPTGRLQLGRVPAPGQDVFPARHDGPLALAVAASGGVVGTGAGGPAGIPHRYLRFLVRRCHRSGLGAGSLVKDGLLD